MGRKIKIPKPKAKELWKLHQILEEALNKSQRRRAEAILLYTGGLSCCEIAKLLKAHLNTIYSDLHEFEKKGLSAIKQPPMAGNPGRITDEQIAEIVRIGKVAPYEIGLPYGRWSLRKLKDYLIKKRVVKTIGHERLRQLLKKGGCTFGKLNANSLAMILNATRSSIE